MGAEYLSGGQLPHPVQRVAPVIGRSTVVFHGSFRSLVSQLRLRRREVFLPSHPRPDGMADTVPTHAPVVGANPGLIA